MIGDAQRLADFERWYARSRVDRLTYEDALAIFVGLWRHARLLNPDFPGNWREDIEADIELARVLNARPRSG
jgi:hypothetical protein